MLLLPTLGFRAATLALLCCLLTWGVFFLFIYVLIFFQCSGDKCSLLVRVLGEEREQNGSAGVAG